MPALYVEAAIDVLAWFEEENLRNGRIMSKASQEWDKKEMQGGRSSFPQRPQSPRYSSISDLGYHIFN